MSTAILSSFSEEGRDLLRGAAGGLIFGTPLLFTMEMWFQGTRFSPAHILGLLAFAALVNIAFGYSAGLRAHNRDHSIWGAMADAATALALGIVVAVAVLALIGQLQAGESLSGLLGKITLQGAAISLGITFTNRKFPRRHGGDGKSGAGEGRYAQLEKAPLSAEQKQARLDFHNMAAVLGGAMVFCFSIAPTEEILLISAGRAAPHILLLLGAEALVCYVILYASEFKEKKVFKKTPMQSPAAEVVMTLALSLVVSAVLLFLLAEMKALASPEAFVAAMVTLGFPAVVGGAAGRLVV